MQHLRPLVKYHGGKYYSCDWIISQLTDHQIYVEPFGGAASVLLNKQPSVVEVYGDVEPTIYNLMNIVKTELGKFLAEIKKLKYCKETYLALRAQYRSPEFAQLPALQRAIITYTVRRMSRGGLCGTFSWSKRIAKDGTPAEEKAWLTMLDEIPKISQRLAQTSIVNQDALEVIKIWDTPDTIMYLDPPYPQCTRVFHNAYLAEMSDDQHVQLGDILKNVQAKIIISSYPSPLYDTLFRGWRTMERLIPNHSSQERKKELKLERLWLNF
jgi:DNA adenine methylase